MANVLKHFDILTKHGMQVMPLEEGYKKPYFKNWQLHYEPAKYRHYLERNPNSNLGLRLGEIVDVEGDSSHANKIIENLIGDYPHPSYTSKKSTHHLFLTPDPKLTRIVFQNVEFRGRYHQSVLPPSVVNGVQYKWKTTVFPIPPMPDRLLEFFKRIRSKRVSNKTKSGHIKVPCIKCRKDSYLHQKRFQKELVAFKTLGQAWQCRKCREVDIRVLCRTKGRLDLFEVV